MSRKTLGILLPSSSLAVVLTIAVAVGASAQVATLAGPDEDAEPSPAVGEIAAPVFEDREDAILAYAQCLRDNGIDMDDPQTGTSGGRGFFGAGAGRGFDIQDEEFLAAQATCAPILEAASTERDPEAEAERLEEMLVLAQCMRANGVEDYPDPVMGLDGRLARTGGPAFIELGLDPRSETFQLAREACAAETGVELAAGGFAPGAGGAAPQGGS